MSDPTTTRNTSPREGAARARSFVQPRCPLRPGDRCSLCVPGASGPHDCGLVWLVMDDPELREQLAQKQQQAQKRAEHRAAATAS
ncbi:DUF6767 domain-containing protein [Aestuariimicrobium soli]|uniref:DUF6767 domain-containing protein n=1 Tax=Aestuariimicrobium soli TaxID=2035834 RepID=UPI003EB969AB